MFCNKSREIEIPTSTFRLEMHTCECPPNASPKQIQIVKSEDVNSSHPQPFHLLPDELI